MNTIFNNLMLRNEFAKRWPLADWYKANLVKKKIDETISDSVIYEILMKQEPALVGRLGGTEARFISEYRKIKKFGMISEFMFQFKPNWRKRSREVNTNAGFYFNSLNEVKDFDSKYHDALIEVDVLGAWGNAFSNIEYEYFRNIKSLIPVDYTAPWIESRSVSSSKIPWAQALNGKNVLVVSPFVDSIQKQFNKISSVFPNHSIHNFNLLTLKSPMTVSTELPTNKSWFEYLIEIESKIVKTNFDVLLVSAGSYSFPLAHFAKKIGKIGIHCGGGLQLFFGIMGKRWEKSLYLNSLEVSWVRPNENEKPTGANLIEGGCYW
jgi:hypothetical protein